MADRRGTQAAGRSPSAGLQTGASAATQRGQRANLAGLAAEASVAADYVRRGYPIARRRFRGRAGEIDLIARDGAGFVLVEVKKAATFARAAERVTRRQIERIFAAAGEFLATEVLGMNTDLRLDVALVDARGMVRIIENVMAD